VKTLAKEVGAALAFAAIGVVVSLAVVPAQGAKASSDEPRVSWVWRGMAPFDGQYCASWNDYPQYQFPGWHECWHDDEPGLYSAIDYNYGSQPDDDAGLAVYLHYEGDFQLLKMLELPDWYNCKGVRAAIYWDSYDGANYRGDIHYLHIDVNEYYIGKELYYQLTWIGNVAEDENPGCWWEGPHLHQSARVSSETPFCSNKFVDPSEGQNWQHKVFWLQAAGESDCDGFTDADELFIGTDELDDCTDKPGDDEAWPPDFDASGKVTSGDLQIFAKHYLMSCTVG
jgi:hypothetical protein